MALPTICAGAPGDRNFPRKISELPLAYASFSELNGDPEIDFTQVPQRVGVFVDFTYRVGRSTARPASWRALFFDEAHDFPGS